MIKHITKTMGPVHFEDLDPRRFEDLVRRLIYDFRNWRDIEPTGKSGSDDGYDARAWEITEEITNIDEEDKEEGVRTITDNEWMIQCKRYKEIGPSRMKKIISEISNKNPPYGYILAASTNFTKKTYDIFREELRKKGVMEFYLWGKDKLEDMLSQPKNDSILYTFFGISLTRRRKSKSTEKKFAINNKNKLIRVLSDGILRDKLHNTILLRDINDSKYPYRGEHKNFDKFPRWKEYLAIEYHPLGLFFSMHEYYGFVNHEKKEFDFTKQADTVYRPIETEHKRWTSINKESEIKNKVIDFYKYIPKKNQAKIRIEGFVPFEEMLIIDDKGDIHYHCPHIFLDYKLHKGPFKFWRYILQKNQTEIDLQLSKYKKVKFFPEKFPEIKKGAVYEKDPVKWDDETLRLFKLEVARGADELFDLDDKYSFLKPRDTILVAGADDDMGYKYIRITHKYNISIGQFFEENKDDLEKKQSLERQIGKDYSKTKEITIFEFEKLREWEAKPKLE